MSLEKKTALKKQLDALEKASKALSKEIGTIKKQGHDASALIQQKKTLQQQQINPIKQRLNALASTQTADEKCQPQGIGMELPAPYPSTVEDQSNPTETIKLIEWSPNAPIQEQWNEYACKHPHGGVYYSWQFFEAVHKAMGHRILLLIATDTQNEIIGCIPLVEQKSILFGHLWTSIALVNYGGVIANSLSIEESLLNELAQQAKQHQIKRLEVRGLYKRPADATLWQLQKDKASMWLALPSDHNSDTLLKQFKAKLRSQIKKGYTEQVSVKVGGIELLDDFYTVFARNMRDLGTPVYGKKFFLELHEALKGAVAITLVYYNNKPASAAFLIQDGSRMEIPWASTIQRYNRHNLNMVLYWEVLKHCCSKQCSVFDFGRSSIDAGTYRFKKQWGTQPIQHYWYSLEPKAETQVSEQQTEPSKVSTDNPKFKLLIACWKRLPVWLSKLLGPHIVKYIP